MNRICAFALAFLLFVPSAFAQDANWLGTVDSDWNNPANWQDNRLPSDAGSLNVQVLSGGVSPVISTPGNMLADTAKQVFVASDMTIAPGGELTGLSSFVTGHIASHDPVIIQGLLSINPGENPGYFNLSGTTAGRGDVIIDGGVVQAVQLSIFVNTATGVTPELTLTNGGRLELWDTLPNTNNPDFWMTPFDYDGGGPLEPFSVFVAGPGEMIQITTDPTTSAQFPVGRRIFTAVPIPEPSCLTLIGLGGLATLLRRRR